MDKPPHTVVRRMPWPETQSHPVVTPFQPSVVYSSPSPDALDDQYEGRASGYTYAREGHPNADVLSRKIDQMEGAPTPGMIHGSGMASISAVFWALTKTGDHVLGGNQLYGRSLRMMAEELPRFGVETTLADPTDAQAFIAAIQDNTRLILLETVSNPTLRIADLKPIIAAARARGILLVVDNTFTTPAGMRPFDLGADIVIHSVTKLLAGHADVTLGYVAARDAEVRQQIYVTSVTMGLTPSPFDCWMAERGLYSFDLRFERAQENAAKLADHLAGLNGVLRVIYPGRADHPDAARAQDLLGANPGNMLSFELVGGRAAANAFTTACPDVAFAPTLGDIATTLSHPASSSHRALTPERRSALGISEGFFRVSVGVEPIEILIKEFTQGVAAASAL